MTDALHPLNIDGTFVFDGIQFKATLISKKSPHSNDIQYSLWIKEGKNGDTIEVGWDYFGTTSWEVSAYRIDPSTNTINLYVKQGLRHIDNILSERIHNVVLSQRQHKKLLITDDFLGVERDIKGNVTHIDVPIFRLAGYDHDLITPPPVVPLTTEKTKKCVSCTTKQPLSFFIDKNGQRGRSCRHCLLNLSTKRVARFPSMAIRGRPRKVQK